MRRLVSCLSPFAGIVFMSLCSPALAATQNFQTPGSHSFTVPAGVTSLQVEVAGAGGGAGSGASVPAGFGMPAELVGRYPGGNGGSGARVMATVAVTPGDVINMIVADSGKGGTLHFYGAPTGSGAGGAGSGSGGATTNAVNADATDHSLSGGGGGGASMLSVAGTYIRAGGGGGGGGMFRSQATFSHGEPGAAGLQPAASTPNCATPANGQPGTGSAMALDNNSPPPGHGYYRTGSGGGGGGGYSGQAGAGGQTPGMIFGASPSGLPVVEFAPTGGGGGGSCTFVGGTRTLTNASSDSQGGAGGIADPAPISTFDTLIADAPLPAPINGTAGWIRLTFSEPVAARPVPGLQPWAVAALAAILFIGFTVSGRRRR